jgi:hypothetical protein
MPVAFSGAVDSLPQFCYLAYDLSGGERGDESWCYETFQHFTR